MLIKILKVFALIMLSICDSAVASWSKISDEELFCGAELIVSGTLGGIQERFMYVSANYDNTPSEWYLDLGLIQDARVIKGEKLYKKDLPVLFDSKGQKGPFSHMKVTHSDGESGIWIISRRDPYTGEYILFKPTNPLPLIDKKRILTTLKKHKCS